MTVYLLRDSEVDQSRLGLDLGRVVRIRELGVQEQPVDGQRGKTSHKSISALMNLKQGIFSHQTLRSPEVLVVFDLLVSKLDVHISALLEGRAGDDGVENRIDTLAHVLNQHRLSGLDGTFHDRHHVVRSHAGDHQ